MFERLQEIDRIATLAINSLNSPVSDSFWQLMSDSKVWIPFYVLLVLFIINKLGPRKAIVVILSVALTVLLCEQLANLVKDSVGRLRPCYDSWCVKGNLHILERRGSLYGFFSAHAANAFGVAICCIVGVNGNVRRTSGGFALWLILWATLVAVSRVFVGKHFMGDVLAGSAG